MSLLDRILEANRHDYTGFLPWRVAGRRVGCVRHGFARELARWPEVFRVDRAGLALAPALDAAGAAARSEALAEVCARLREQGRIGGWRDERYPVATRWAAEPLLLLERAAVPLFGVTAYGVHLNGYVRGCDGATRMWVARRARSKPTGPGKLDQIVAGGQPHGIGLLDNLIKECAEEAGIPPARAARARPVGALSYVLETEQGMRPDVIFNFDLELDADFEPVNHDGEVEAFQLWDLDRVRDTVAGSDAFKFNCALVVIDFLLRHGHLGADDPDYEAIARGLLPDLSRVPAHWETASNPSGATGSG